MKLDSIMGYIEGHPVLITICIFFLGGIGFMIKHFFFSGKKQTALYIKAGRDISPGGDIVVGDKVVNSLKNGSKDLKEFERLLMSSKWRKETINHKEIWVNENDNTFQIEMGDHGEEFREHWHEMYPDPVGQRYPVYLTINNSRIKELLFISCDGGRILVPIPDRHFEEDKRAFRWVRDSLSFKVCSIIGHYYIYKNIEGIARVSKIKIV